jgi:hypothetical protein
MKIRETVEAVERARGVGDRHGQSGPLSPETGVTSGVFLGIPFVEVRSRFSWVLLFVLCAFGVVGVASAAGVTKDGCPTFSSAGETSTSLSVSYPAGLVLVGSSSAKLGALIGTAAGQTTYMVAYGGPLPGPVLTGS